MGGEAEQFDADDYVLVTESDGEEYATIGEKPEVVAKIKKWLSPTEFDSDTSEYKKHLNAHVHGTGQWILDTEQYKKWHDTAEIGDLWIRGIPGSGKSVVAANLVRDLKLQAKAPVLFFFFRHIIETNRTPHSMMRDCSFQLIDHCPQLQSSLKAAMSEHPKVGELPYDEIWQCFSSALRGMKRVYCVIDALDEMELGNEYFLETLLSLGRAQPTSIKLALTSRQLPRLETIFRGSCLVDLRLDRRNVDKDIAIYITHRLRSCATDINPEQACEIEKSVCDRGKGLFLYARLMMDQCLRNPQQFLSHLDILPDGLGNMYSDLLKEHAVLSGTTQEFQKMILEWVTHSSRPLRLIELSAIVSSLPNRGGLKANQDTKLAVRSCCGPLLEICEDEVVQIIHHSFTEFLLDPDISHIQMASTDRFPVLNSSSVHASIARRCIAYMQSGCFSTWKIRDRVELPLNNAHHSFTHRTPDREILLRYHFLQYCVDFWTSHAAKVKSDEPLLNDLDDFMQDDNHCFEAWKDFSHGSRASTPKNHSPLHVSANFGLTALAERLLDRGADSNVLDGFKYTPIAYAATEGHRDVAALLLLHNAQMGIPDQHGFLPIHHAAKNNHPAILRVLLEAGENPHTEKHKVEDEAYYSRNSIGSSIGYTPLYYICTSGHVESLIELQRYLKPGELVNGALHCAVAMQRVEVVQVLLQDVQVRAQIDEVDKNENTPLYLAARGRNVKIVKLLLDNGANVHARSQDLRSTRRSIVTYQQRVSKPDCGFTPLHGLARLNPGSGFRGFPASNRGPGTVEDFEQILDLLLAAGADINARDSMGQTALYSWNEPGQAQAEFNNACVRLLIKRGIDVKVTDSEGNTVLHQMYGVPNERPTIQLFIDAGLDINATRKSDKQTPLMRAALKSQIVDPVMMRELGANIDLQDSNGSTALHLLVNTYHLSSKDSEAWMKCADFTIMDNTGRPSVSYMRRINRPDQLSIEVIRQMLERVDLEHRDCFGRTILLNILERSVVENCGEFVDELLARGACVKVRDYQGRTALHYIVRMHSNYSSGSDSNFLVRLNFMKKMIEKGADMQAVDYSGNSIFHHTIDNGMPWVVIHSSINAMKELGVDLTTANYSGRTGLHIAAGLPKPRSFGTHPSDPYEGCLDYLLDAEPFDVNARDYQGYTPLHIAAAVNEIAVWKLIQHGANAMARTGQGLTPLHIAAQAGKCNIVHLLTCRRTKSKLSLDDQCLRGRTALYYAVMSGKPESVKTLLDAGASTEVLDFQGRNLLHAVAEYDKITSGKKAQVSRGLADARIIGGFLPSRPPALNPRNAFEKMGLTINQEDDNQNIRQVIDLLLHIGVDSFALDNNEHTPVEVAMILGNMEAARALHRIMEYRTKTGKDSKAFLCLDKLGAKLLGTQIYTNDLEPFPTDPDDIVFLMERICSSGDVYLMRDVLSLHKPELTRKRGSSALHFAAKWGLTEMMDAMIGYITNINAFSTPLLITAIERGEYNVDMIKLLIRKGANVNHPLRGGPQTRPAKEKLTYPLHKLAVGAEWWHPEAMIELLDAGADIEMMDEQGSTPLYIAICSGNPYRWAGRGFWCDQTLEILLKNGASVNVLTKDPVATPLNEALDNHRGKEIVQKLLDYGADASLGPKPVITSAIGSQDYDCLEMLLKAGANPNVVYTVPKTRNYPPNPNAGLIEMPLLKAACHNGGFRVSTKDLHGDIVDETDHEKTVSIIQLLLDYNADPVFSMYEGTSTCLHEIASQSGILAPILATRPDLEVKDSLGRTPLLRACEVRSIHTYYQAQAELAFQELVDAGADINSMDSNRSTALHYAAKSGLPQATRILIEKGLAVQQKDKNGISPFHQTLDNLLSNPNSPINTLINTLDVLQVLVDSGADIQEADPQGKTPLHYLATLTMSRMVLHESETVESAYRSFSSIDPSRNDTSSDSPAKIFGMLQDLYSRFIASGCDREALDNDGCTPIFGFLGAVRMHPYIVAKALHEDEYMKNMLDSHNLFVKNKKGDGLLHAVAKRESRGGATQDTLVLWNMLVERGLDPRMENEDGVTPLDVAATCGNKNILELYGRDE